MRYSLIDSLLLGSSIGFIVLAIHALTDGVAPHYQLVALLLAGAALFGIQLLVALRRARRDRRAPEYGADQEDELFRHNRRNPFFRELTRDWTGLDERPPAGEAEGEPPRNRAGENRE